MKRKYDEFNDVKERERGIFTDGLAGAESALHQHDAVHHEYEAEGLRLEFECQGCGSSTRVLVEWPELVALKYGHNPAVLYRQHRGIVENPMAWEIVPEERAWRPLARCLHCNFNFCLRLGLREPDRHLEAGMRAGLINPTGAAQVEQLCQSAARPAPGGGWAGPGGR